MKKKKLLRRKKIKIPGVKLGYLNALNALKRLAKEYDFGKSDNKLMKGIINDFEYCADKTERFNKLDQAKQLYKEAFSEPEIEGACPFCKSVNVKEYDDVVEDAGVLLINRCMDCKEEWQEQ